MTADPLLRSNRAELELADRLITVMAPAGWPDARVEAWLDGDEVLFTGAAETLADQSSPGSASSPRPKPAAPSSLMSRRSSSTRAVQGPSGRRARQLKQPRIRLGLIARRLTAVIEAFGRCEGEPEACADPLKNVALGRAARAAREAGVSDELIVRAIALAKAGETLWRGGERPPRRICRG